MIRTSDPSIFRDAINKVSQQSRKVVLAKDARKFVISSMSSDELCYATLAFNQLFFSEWDCKTMEPVEVDSKTLYEVSNAIQKKSELGIDVRKTEIVFDIRDLYRKTITLTDLKKTPDQIGPRKRMKPSIVLCLEAGTFLNVLRELATLLDETQLSLKKNPKTIIFRGKKAGMHIELQPSEKWDVNIEENISIEFPTRLLQHFSPLLSRFPKLLLSFAPTTPLNIEARNRKWKLVLLISKIDSPLSETSY